MDFEELWRGDITIKKQTHKS